MLTTRSKAVGIAERLKKAKDRPWKVCLVLGMASSCWTPPASTRSSANLCPHQSLSGDVESMQA